MLGPGPLIAINIVFLYTIIGPVVLFGTYVLFDVLIKTVMKKTTENKRIDPSLMNSEDVLYLLDRT